MSSLLSAELTEQHRLLQNRIGATAAATVLRLWALLDIDRLDETMEGWVDTISRLVAGERDRSEELARRYVTAHRQSLLGFTAPPPPPFEIVPLEAEALRTSLLVTGPYRLRKNLSKGVAFDRAVDMAKADSAGAAMRHVLSGSREAIITAANTDPRVEGVQRVTAASPCSFCAMLASRGPVYRSEESADFKPHDSCGCEPELVYDRNAPLAPTAARFQAQWNDAKRLAGKENISTQVAFRRLHENRA